MDFFEKNSFPRNPDIILERRIETKSSVSLLVKYKGCIIGCGTIDRGSLPNQSETSWRYRYQSICDKLESIQFPLVYTYGFTFILSTNCIYYRSTFGEAEKGVIIESIEKLYYYIGLVLQEIETDQKRRERETENVVNKILLKQSESHIKMIEKVEMLLEENSLNSNTQFEAGQIKEDIQHLKDALDSSIVPHNAMTFRYYFEQYYPHKY